MDHRYHYGERGGPKRQSSLPWGSLLFILVNLLRGYLLTGEGAPMSSGPRSCPGGSSRRGLGLEARQAQSGFLEGIGPCSGPCLRTSTAFFGPLSSGEAPTQKLGWGGPLVLMLGRGSVQRGESKCRSARSHCHCRAICPLLGHLCPGAVVCGISCLGIYRSRMLGVECLALWLWPPWDMSLYPWLSRWLEASSECEPNLHIPK